MNKLIYKLRDRLGRLSPTDRAEYLRKNKIISMGTGCEVFSNVEFGSEPYLITIGNNVRITGGVKFINHDGGMWVVRNLKWSPKADKIDTIKIGDNVMIGNNAAIMPGVTIGSNVIVGLGSIVLKDVPDNTVVAGTPAKVISSIEDYFNKNLNKIDETKHMNYDEKKEYYLGKYNLK